MAEKNEKDRFERKRNLTIYAIIVISFIAISVYMFTGMNKKDNTDADKKNHPEISQNTSETDNGEIYESDIKKTAEEFLALYHDINEIDRMPSFEKTRTLLTDKCYNELYSTVEVENNMPRGGYVYRKTDKKSIYNYEYISESNKAKLTVKMYSKWFDENNNIVNKNELTEYNLTFVRESGKWKISNITSKSI